MAKKKAETLIEEAPLVEYDKLVFRWNKHRGIVEGIDPITGQVVLAQESMDAPTTKKMVRVRLPSGVEVLSSPGLDLTGYMPPKLGFNKIIADIILDRLQEGESLKKALKGIDISPATVLRWAEQLPSFGDALARARAVRAEQIHDKILDTAEEMLAGDMTKGELDSVSRGIENLKWIAEKDSPNRFGNKKDTAFGGATTIIIQTGVTREEVIEVKDGKSE